MSQLQFAYSIQQNLGAFLANNRDQVNFRLVNSCFRYFPLTSKTHRAKYWKHLCRDTKANDDRIFYEILLQQDHKPGFKAASASGRSKLVYKILDSKYGQNFSNQMLLSAATNGHSELATKISHYSNNLDESLVIGCMSGNEELVEYCLSKTPSANAINLAVHTTIENDKTQIFSSICSKFHNLIVDKQRALTFAFEKKEMKLAQLMMDNYPDALNEQTVSDALWSSQNSHLELVDMLLLQDPVYPLNLLKAFKIAAVNGNYPVFLRLLQDPRVDPSAENNYAIRFAAENGHYEVVDRLLQDPRVDPSANDNKAIIEAAANGHFLVLDRLLQDPRIGPSDVSFSITLAALMGHSRVVSRLLEDPRADPTENDNWAIRTAAEEGYDAIVDILLNDPRVDPSASDNVAIRNAARLGHLKVVNRLLEDPRVDPSGGNNTAILHAVKKGHFIILDRLLQDPRNWNITNLKIAYEHDMDRFHSISEFLLQQHVDVTSQR